MLLGSSFALATGGLGWLGHQGDLRFGTDPWLAVLGVLLGFLYGGYEVWKISRMTTEPESEQDDS
jgi:F0F1-type ATP synthase assembly protein I